MLPVVEYGHLVVAGLVRLVLHADCPVVVVHYDGGFPLARRGGNLGGELARRVGNLELEVERSEGIVRQLCGLFEKF